MKVLAIMGSHRKGGNTAQALDAFLSGLPESVTVERIELIDQTIGMCKACGYCERHYGKCILEDDMTALYEAFKTADGVIFATPVYFNGVSTLMKMMVDRIQMVFACDFAFKEPFVDPESLKRGYLISVGGAKAYEKQFIGPEICVELVLKDLHASFLGHHKISNTDALPVKERTDELEALKKAGADFLK
ncbi:MAG: NAD(P)H-dependent oxidoreductase [Clostridia bacterium]|nr:NAD(P)H-dependent oxidoreductase [Clostridia bacterium]